MLTMHWPCRRQVHQGLHGMVGNVRRGSDGEGRTGTYITNIYLTLCSTKNCVHMCVSIQAQTDNTVMMVKLIDINKCYQDWVVTNKVVADTEAQIDKMSKRLIGLHMRCLFVKFLRAFTSPLPSSQLRSQSLPRWLRFRTWWEYFKSRTSQRSRLSHIKFVMEIIFKHVYF